MASERSLGLGPGERRSRLVAPRQGNRLGTHEDAGLVRGLSCGENNPDLDHIHLPVVPGVTWLFTSETALGLANSGTPKRDTFITGQVAVRGGA